jgi:Family of unknown function (DUF5856)
MTHSHPRHVSSDKLFESMAANVDRFVEVYIGKYGRPQLKKNDTTLPIKVHSDTSIVEFLDEVVAALTGKTLAAYASDKEVDLLTIRDEMVADLNQTKYLFTLR